MAEFICPNTSPGAGGKCKTRTAIGARIVRGGTPLVEYCDPNTSPGAGGKCKTRTVVGARIVRGDTPLVDANGLEPLTFRTSSGSSTS